MPNMPNPHKQGKGKGLLHNMKENKTRKRLRNASFQEKFGRWLIEAGTLCLLTCLICSRVLALGKVPTESMEPTIKSGQKIIGLRLSYLFSKPGRGDIVAFAKNADGGMRPLCKRIIGIPGGNPCQRY